MVAMKFFSLAFLPALAWAVSNVIDDTDPQIQYDTKWTPTTDHVFDGGISTNYYNGTSHTSTTVGATFSFVFTGTAITYYGDVDVDNADFVVNIDQTSTTHAAKASAYKSNQVLFTISGLSNTQHTFTVTHSGAAGEWATLDRLVYESDTARPIATITINGGTGSGSQGSQGLPAAAISTNNPTANQTTGLPTAAIIGIAVGGAVILIALVAFLIIFLRRRRRMQVQANHDIDFLQTEYPQPQVPASQWITPFNLAAAAPSGGNYAPVPYKPQDLSPAPVVASLLPPSYDEVESQAATSEVARSTYGDPYNDSEYTPSSSAYAPSSAGFVRAASASGSSSTQRTYPVDRKVRNA